MDWLAHPLLWLCFRVRFGCCLTLNTLDCSSSYTCSPPPSRPQWVNPHLSIGTAAPLVQVSIIFLFWNGFLLVPVGHLYSLFFPYSRHGELVKSIESDNITLLKNLLCTWNKIWINCHHLQGSARSVPCLPLVLTFAVLSLVHSALAVSPRHTKISSPRYIRLVPAFTPLHQLVPLPGGPVVIVRQVSDFISSREVCPSLPGRCAPVLL